MAIYCFLFIDVFFRFWTENGLTEGREGFERILEAVGFILTEFELKRSHGDPIRGRSYGFGTDDW